MASLDPHVRKKKSSPDHEDQEKVTVAKQLEPSAGYDEYLLLLHQRNKLLEKFKGKDEKQRDLERKEQGFCLYVNGANVAASKLKGATPSPRRPNSRKLLSPFDAQEIESALARSRLKSGEPVVSGRSKTAPEKVARKNWQASSMQIKTGKGDKMHIHAPDDITGKYKDDFDEYVSESFCRDSSKDESSDDNSDDDMHMQNVGGSSGYRHTAPILPDGDEFAEEVVSEDCASNDEEDMDQGINERLTLSIAEVRALRTSLVMNPKISKNFSRLESVSSESGGDSDADDDKSEAAKHPLQQLHPEDTIVLEFAPPKAKEPKQLRVVGDSNGQRHLPAAGTVVPLGLPKVSNSLAPSTTTRRLPASIAVKKVDMAGPVTSSRKVSTAEAIETSAERSAVIAALQAENERMSSWQPSPRRGVVSTPRHAPATAASNQVRSASASEISSRPAGGAETLFAGLPPSMRRGAKECFGDPVSDSAAIGSSATGLAMAAAAHLSYPEISERVKLATEKVLQMNPDQQRKLLVGLERLEQVAANTANNGNGRKFAAATTVANESDSANDKDTALQDQCIQVTMEWLSNWGHTARIGMTEVQLFDHCNKQVLASLVDPPPHASSALNAVGKVEYLFNQKFKTVKEKNMFSCLYDKDVPVVITFVVTISSPVAYLKMWNYNKSMDELSVGVRRVRLSLDGLVVFDGELDKGCGNQVFDYSTVVNVSMPLPSASLPDAGSVKLRASPAAAVNGQERAVRPGAARTLAEAEQEARASLTQAGSSQCNPKPLGQPASHKVAAIDSRAVTTDVESGKLKAVKLVQKAQMPMVSKKMTAHLAHIAGASEQESASTGSRTSKPPWLPCPTLHGTKGPQSLSREMVATSASQKPAWLKKDGHGGDESRNEASRLPKRGDELTVLSSWPHKGVPHLHTVFDELPPAGHQKSLVRQDLVVADELEEARWRKEVSSNLRRDGSTGSDKDPSMVSEKGAETLSVAADTATTVLAGEEDDETTTPLKRIERSRARWRNNRDLEKSWSSLSTFNHNQRGRISMDLEGDILDEYLWSARGTATPADKTVTAGDVVIGPAASVAMGGDTAALPARAGSAGEKPKSAATAVGSAMAEVAAAPTATLAEADDDDEDFVIPELPYGKELVVDIKTTWGDRYYVGLNGIEIFTSSGEPAAINKISAEPADVNILPGYGNDPRVVQNLIDGVNRTRDDIHMWLAPFTPGGSHRIFVTFDRPCHVALMRLWNYNKSRIHSYRGAKDVDIVLDGKHIFKGEIARACGSTQGGTEAFGDTILFTTSEEILDAISHYDEYYEGAERNNCEADETEEDRPKTADSGSVERPFTSVNFPKGAAINNNDTVNNAKDAYSMGALGTEGKDSTSVDQSFTSAPHVLSQDGDVLVYRGKKMVLNFTETWGDQFYLGLTGIELIGRDGSALPVTIDIMEAAPRDLHVLAGYENDDRTLDKVIDGINITSSDEHMWLIPYTQGQDHKLTFTFEEPTSFVGVRFWNYNKSPEDTYRGAKVVHVEVDGLELSPPSGLLIRKAPGSCYFDFAQELIFSDVLKQCCNVTSSADESDGKVQDNVARENYLTPVMPTGFIYQFHLLSTWGDHYYVGLNGLEFFDGAGNKIKLDENNIAAYPQSVNVLEGVNGDVRTPDKLVDGVNDTTDPRHMWLAPILPGMPNRVFVIFDQPQTVSMIKIWNYSKMANRGVKEFALLVDDLLVWNGQLNPVLDTARGILPTCDIPLPHHTILFTDEPSIVTREKHSVVISNLQEEQDIRLTNDSKIVTATSKQRPFAQKVLADQALRPKTSVTGTKKTHMRK